ncbi:MAG: Uma2 family endonuclease [Chloroflexi bacterium]|nr:Uma2 family endonuclease [Chloroflexota bacterium]
MAAHIITPPILESGDHLTRDEFHRRYCERPDIRKAELVEGVVYVASPVRVIHGVPHASVVGWLYAYHAKTPGVQLGIETTVRLDAPNEVQPDACLWREELGGPRLSADGYIEGSPQLVAEVAASSASYDLHAKKEAYRRNGVQEYIVWRVLEENIVWFRLHEGEYVSVEPDERSVIESAAFPGLRLHVARMLAGDAAAVLAELETHPGG